MLARFAVLVPVFALLVAAARFTAAAPTGNPVYDDPARVDADFAAQGEYVAEVAYDGQRITIGAQIVAEGDGTFAVVAYPGGLPGAGWLPPAKFLGKARRDGDVVKIEGVDWTGATRTGEIRDGKLVALGDDGAALATFDKVTRQSPTLGKAPPEGALVIFNGQGVEGLVDGRMTPDGLLMEGVTTAREFGDATWHIEFRLPYQPKDRGQARGNSGAYLLGAYEVQMLDSFGLEGKDNECGGIYKAAPPVVNMCLPPLAWQTYDIDVKAPRFENGEKVANARMTVRHNGVLIHNDVEIPAGTPGGPKRMEGPTGPLFLQNHGNPVRYRNVWVLPKS
jgi:hypothetical protein